MCACVRVSRDARLLMHLPPRSKLFYVLLERLLTAESIRLGGIPEAMTVLLRHDKFHRSLLWCATEIVFTTYRFAMSDVLFPRNLALIGVTAFDVVKVISSVVR